MSSALLKHPGRVQPARKKYGFSIYKRHWRIVRLVALDLGITQSEVFERLVDRHSREELQHLALEKKSQDTVRAQWIVREEQLTLLNRIATERLVQRAVLVRAILEPWNRKKLQEALK